MDITSLISLISSLNSNNPNSKTSGVMNFFAQNQSAQKQNENTSAQNAQNQSLNINQILPLLSMLGGANAPNISSILPLLSMINAPGGLSGIANIPGMQNFAPIMENIGKTKAQQNSSEIIRLKGNNKKISDYKKI